MSSTSYEPKKGNRVTLKQSITWCGKTVPAGAIGTVMEDNYNPWVQIDSYKSTNDCGDIDFHGAFPIHETNLKLINKPIDLLQPGYVIQLRDESVYLVLLFDNGFHFVRQYGYRELSADFYNDNLQHPGGKECDVMTITKPYDELTLNDIINSKVSGTVIWKREEIPFVKAEVGDIIKVIRDDLSHSPDLHIGDEHKVTLVRSDCIETDKGNSLEDFDEEYVIVTKAKDVVKELTVAEISKQLGYTVKVVE